MQLKTGGVDLMSSLLPPHPPPGITVFTLIMAMKEVASRTNYQLMNHFHHFPLGEG